MANDKQIDRILDRIENDVIEADKPYSKILLTTLEADLEWLNKWHLTGKPSRISRLKAEVERHLQPF